jgi:hypothetical protein
MAPFWAEAHAAAPTTTKRRAARAANLELIVLRIQVLRIEVLRIEALFTKRDTFKTSSR